jgi:hypothetical protein
MSVRHTRTGPIANQLHDGTLFVPGLEPCWFANTGQRGRHRRPHAVDMQAGCVYYAEPVFKRVTDPDVYPDENVSVS